MVSFDITSHHLTNATTGIVQGKHKKNETIQILIKLRGGVKIEKEKLEQLLNYFSIQIYLSIYSVSILDNRTLRHMNWS